MIFPHNLEQRQNLCSRLCTKLQRVSTKHLNIHLLVPKTMYMHFTAWKNVQYKGVMNNFLTRTVRIQVQITEISHVILRLELIRFFSSKDMLTLKAPNMNISMSLLGLIKMAISMFRPQTRHNSSANKKHMLVKRMVMGSNLHLSICCGQNRTEISYEVRPTVMSRHH